MAMKTQSSPVSVPHSIGVTGMWATMPGSSYRYWDPNSGPRGCIASTLTH